MTNFILFVGNTLLTLFLWHRMGDSWTILPIVVLLVMLCNMLYWALIDLADYIEKSIKGE